MRFLSSFLGALLRRASRLLHDSREVFSHSPDPAAREIFEFFDGQETRAVDPLAVYRALWTDGQCDLKADAKIAADPKMIRDGVPVRSIYTLEEVTAAEGRVMDLTRRAFGLKPFEEGGLTLLETDALLGRFLRYVEGIKKKRNPSRTTTPISAPTGSASSDLTPPENSAPTNSASDCGCTVSESAAAAPTE